MLRHTIFPPVRSSSFSVLPKMARPKRRRLHRSSEPRNIREQLRRLLFRRESSAALRPQIGDLPHSDSGNCLDSLTRPLRLTGDVLDGHMKYQEQEGAAPKTIHNKNQTRLCFRPTAVHQNGFRSSYALKRTQARRFVCAEEAEQSQKARKRWYLQRIEPGQDGAFTIHMAVIVSGREFSAAVARCRIC
jgi:hypothetical protein